MAEAIHDLMTRNPKYWNKPLPYLDGLVFKIISDENQRLNSMKAGELDALYTPSQPQTGVDAAKAGFQTIKYEPSGGLTIFLNMKKILEAGDVDEAINAAASVGDDRLQQQATGHVNQDSFTHGSSAQRSTPTARTSRGTGL